jgi:hypothetical protein
MVKTQIKNGIVVNTIVVDPDNIPDWCADWPTTTGDAGIGWLWDGTNFIDPETPVDTGAPNANE